MWRWAVPVGLGLLAAWRPFEVDPLSGLVAAGAILLAVLLGREGGWRVPSLRGTALPAAWIALGIAVGWDRAGGIQALVLAATLLLVVLAAARSGNPGGGREALALGIGLLTLWGAWQVAGGLRADLGELGRTAVPAPWAVRHRLETGRAFASQLHPGHLAVLLAMVLPLGLEGVLGGRRWRGAAAVSLAVAGLVLARSPLGVALALAAGAAVLRKKAPRWSLAAAAFLGGILLAVVLARPDLARWEPFVHRWQNWHNALWVWKTSPVTGVGLGGFGTAALAVPFPVSNHPRHAHDLPLEWLAEMGLPGLVLAGALYWWLWGLARRTWRWSPGLAAAILVVPAHNLLDFSLFVSGVAVPWAVLVGWALAGARGEDGARGPAPPPNRRAVAALALLVFAFHAAGAASAALEGRAALPGTSAARAMDLLRAARSVAPWRSGSLEEVLELARREPQLREEGLRELERARWWWPRSPGLAASGAGLAAASGDLPEAWRGAWESEALGVVRGDRSPGVSP